MKRSICQHKLAVSRKICRRRLTTTVAATKQDRPPNSDDAESSGMTFSDVFDMITDEGRYPIRADPTDSPSTRIPKGDGRRTMRERKSNDEPLPYPPFMDPLVQGAKRRHQARKPVQDKAPLTPLQQDLVSNPYGALSPCPHHLKHH